MSRKPLIDPANEKVISPAEETKFEPNSIVSRILLQTDTSRVVLFGSAKGQELADHTSTQQVVIQILSGEGELSLAGDPHQLKAGDKVCMSPGQAHVVKATKRFSMLLTLSKPAEPLAGTPEIKTTSAIAA